MQKPLIYLFLSLTSFQLFAHCPEESHQEERKAVPIDKPVFVGNKNTCFVTVPHWGRRKEQNNPGPTHGSIVIDKEDHVYVCTDTKDSILVYTHDGKFLKSIGEPNLKIHGLTLTKEGNQEFIYGASLAKKEVFKMLTSGDVVWKLGLASLPAPYAFKTVTAIAVAKNGDFYVSDGYGTQKIVKFSSDRKPIKVIGRQGKGNDGQFNTCHGLIIDERSGKEELLVADRENRRVVVYDLDLNFKRVLIDQLRRPCSFSIWEDKLAIAELEARVTILDGDNKIIAQLGSNANKKQWANYRVKPDKWVSGVFTAPHGLSFDSTGNLYVQDWNRSGRITKLLRLH